jgi:hypothetical protein
VKRIQNNKPITISKLAFLDEMLEFPKLEETYCEYNDEKYYSLEVDQRFENLIKTLAAKILSEWELMETLGDSRKDYSSSKKITYTA